MRNGGTINVNIEIDIEKIALAVPPEDGPLFLFKLFSYFAPESVAAAYVAFDSLQAYYVRKGANKKPEQRKKRHKTQLIEQTVSFLHSHMQGVFEVKVIFHRIKRHNPTEPRDHEEETTQETNATAHSQALS